MLPKTQMSAFYDPSVIKSILGCYLVIDTNILTSFSASDESYFLQFLEIFKGNPFLIDPIVKFEFLRGSSGTLFEEKSKFLEFDNFHSMIDHQDIYKKTYNNAFPIAKIYANNNNPDIPLGDLLIVSRLMLYGKNYLFVTLDKNDFSTVLFDRIGVVSIERKSAKGKDLIEHILILRFNDQKYKECLKRIEQTK